MGECYSDAVSIPCSGLLHTNGSATERLRTEANCPSPQTRGMETEEEDKEENDDEVIVNL